MSGPARKDQRQWPLDGQRILVVDDNTHSAALIRQALLAAGAYEVVVAGDGGQALTVLSQMRPDVLVTDMIMPVTGGLKLVTAIRQAALIPDLRIPNPAIPIVLVSAFGNRQSVRQAQAAGIDAFVIKPFSLGSLVKRVERAGRRTAAFIVGPNYIGPDRRAIMGRGARRRSDPKVETVVDSASQLQALYARIKVMEAERAAEPAT